MTMLPRGILDISGNHWFLMSFFAKSSPVHTTISKLTQRLSQLKIPYTFMGGYAVNCHGFSRSTEDVDVLVTPEGLKSFQQNCVGKGFLPAFQGATKKFKDTSNNVGIHFLTTGEFPGNGKSKPVAFPPPTDVAQPMEIACGEEKMMVQVINLHSLVSLKLCSYMDDTYGRGKDLNDVLELIRRHLELQQPEAITKLPTYVHEEFKKAVKYVEENPTEGRF
eukprot:TRINITY_DN32959_c0_g1_i2.p1 TRINITY_DN32959_c0_g1~~TRINITY_DN32959_c0_g1_i2.p1  ORF type:complete len:221 (-),score=30.99 TRINITY_DN32959_c0_g1_i2:128-790(-)